MIPRIGDRVVSQHYIDANDLGSGHSVTPGEEGSVIDIYRIVGRSPPGRRPSNLTMVTVAWDSGAKNDLWPRHFGSEIKVVKRKER